MRELLRKLADQYPVTISAEGFVDFCASQQWLILSYAALYVCSHSACAAILRGFLVLKNAFPKEMDVVINKEDALVIY